VDELNELYALIDSLDSRVIKQQFKAFLNVLSEDQIHELLNRMRSMRQRRLDEGGFVT
jgi:hypothetical protein